MIKGSIPALVTPFKNGEVDLDTLKKLVDWQIEQGSTGLVPVGTTGESPTLSHEEHEAVVEAVVRQRVRALEAFLADVYGPGEILADGVVPYRAGESIPWRVATLG